MSPNKEPVHAVTILSTALQQVTAIAVTKEEVKAAMVPCAAAR